jgi:excisionase family DNA binding protein
MLKILYSVLEACAALGIGKTTLYQLHNDGRIKFLKVGRSTKIERAELERLVASFVDAT